MKKNILIAAVMFFALSVAAFAQATFTVGSVPVTTVACCGQTEKTGDISFTMVFGSPLSATGTITITYPVPITNSGSLNAPGGIQVVSVPPVSGLNVVSATASTVTQGQVVIAVPAFMNFPSSFRLTGVRVDVSGRFSGSISASASSTYNLLTAGETSFTVIENIAQPLAHVASLFAPVYPNPVTINAVTGAVSTATAMYRVREGFLDAFGQTVASDITQNISKMIRLKVSNIPAGVRLTFPGQDANLLFTRSSSAGVTDNSNVAVTSADNPATLYYRLTADSAPSAFEYFQIYIQVATTAGATYPLSAGSVSISAHIAPIDSGIPKTMIPRYADLAECETTAATIVTIAGGSTTLLIPYAQTADVWDTGIAIANTTKDPGLAAMSFAGAVAQSGTISFYLYPQNGGTALTYTTQAGSPGTGLDATGKLAAGQLYTVMLSQIVPLAGGAADGSFSGYVFVVTNFTNAHGEFFVYDSDPISFVHGALMLVVNSARSAGMEALNN